MKGDEKTSPIHKYSIFILQIIRNCSSIGFNDKYYVILYSMAKILLHTFQSLQFRLFMLFIFIFFYVFNSYNWNGMDLFCKKRIHKIKIKERSLCGMKLLYNSVVCIYYICMYGTYTYTVHCIGIVDRMFETIIHENNVTSMNWHYYVFKLLKFPNGKSLKY